MADKQGGATETGGSEGLANTPADAEDVPGRDTPEPGSKESAAQGDAGKPDRFSVRPPFIRRSQAEAQPLDENVPAAPSGKPVKHRFINRLNAVVFSVAKALLFALTAAVTGALAAALLLQYAETSPSAAERRAALASLTEELAALQNSVQSLSRRFAAADSAGNQLSALSDQVAALSGEAADLARRSDESAAAGLRFSENLEELTARVALTEASLDEVRNGISGVQPAASGEHPDARIEDLILRLGVLETAAMTASPPDSGTAARYPVRTLEMRMAAVDTRLERLEKFQSESEAEDTDRLKLSYLAEVESRVLALEVSLGDDVRDQDVLPRLAALEGRLSELEIRGVVSEPQQRLALLGVRAAAEIGSPYSSLIDSSTLSAADIPEIVRIHADSGIASLDNLRAGFGGYSREALSAPSADGETGSASGILRSLFRVRPLSPQEGEDPAAVLSRAEAALRKNDLEGALAQLSGLSAASRDLMADWIEAAEARVAVLAALDGILKTADRD